MNRNAIGRPDASRPTRATHDTFRPMRRRMIAGAALAGLATATTTVARAMPIDGVARAIPAIDQGNANLCWLAGAAMLVSWKSGTAISMRALAEALGGDFLPLYRAGMRSPAAGGLPFPMVGKLATEIGATTAPLASFDLPWWSDRLRTSPMLVGGWSQGATMAHVQLLASMSGDIAPGKPTWATVIDPAGGIVRNEPFGEVIAFYEGLPKHNLGKTPMPRLADYPPQLMFYGSDGLR